MAMAGMPWWKMVTTDTAGVPAGGPFGDVAWFEREAGKHGLLIGWSRIHHRFGVFTRLGPAKYTFQMLLDKPEGAIPFSPQLLWLLLHVWENDARHSNKAMNAIIRDLQQASKQAAMKAQYEGLRDHAVDAAGESLHRQRRRVVFPMARSMAGGRMR